MLALSKLFETKKSIGRVVLVALCLQNASFTLLRRYVSMTEHVSSREILIVGELIKFFVSIYFISNSVEKSSSEGIGVAKLWWLVKNSRKMIILSAIYLAMNVLSFVSIQYIGAGEFTVCGQLKVLSTATFSVIVLGTNISNTKWRALAQLVIGCILVTSPALEAYTADKRGDSIKAVEENTNNSALVLQFGYGAVLLEVLLSGFASIYFEKVIKSSDEIITIWERNFQLSFYSIIIYAAMIAYDITTNASATLFGGWEPMTVLVACLGAAGGLLVASSLKYADSILKTIATAGAIIISTVLGYLFLDGPMTYIVMLGMLTTVLSIFNYTLDMTPS